MKRQSLRYLNISIKSLKGTVPQWLNSAGTALRYLSDVPPPEIAVPQPEVVALPPGFVLMVHTVIFGIIIAIVATRV